MIIVDSIVKLKEIVRNNKKNGHTIGFVPTMGFLHEGHLTLAKKARKENDTVIMSIFVNPLQFGPNEDFERYPRDPEKDAALAESSGVDYLFMPSVDEMYPEEPAVALTVKKRTNVLCGIKREGHFDGVATVVMKLFHMTEPDNAYFGKKDAQQLAVIYGLVDSLNVPVTIHGVETVREEDGLAKSSRNVYLQPEERERAPALYQSLSRLKESIDSGETRIERVREQAIDYLNLHSGAEIEYLEILAYPELEPIQRATGTIIAAAAVQYKNARLIDNIIFTVKGRA
ncbi:pantoate--beta-alanine ligase [Domibacillus epiphyticus]|uniref:Pantothenate synthetase n=1 Tax=Domibacillus epiphyticus TaxID=1714355 RepID=A0A1V2A4B3_9BACI|nr:pantoate--beta-alanine ligase [Domibacillus epiphyticus]OMP65841.1 pantoate--beta-alanine ligase [Domibacillus epiphyticus]